MIKLVIADDHPIVRRGIIDILSIREDILLAGEAVNGDELIALCHRYKPDIAICDVSMPGESIMQLIPAIKECSGETRIIIFSIHDPDDFAIPLLKAGASAYVCKQNSSDDLLAAIDKVISGNIYIPDKLPSEISKELRSNKKVRFSTREFEVLKLLSQGKTFKSIADELSISPKTVSTYRTRLIEKLQLSSSNDLIKYAHQKFSI